MAQVGIVAPAGTEILAFTWDARMRRVDCRYAMQTWAVIPGSKPTMLFNGKANRDCARPGRAQIAAAKETDALHSRSHRDHAADQVRR